MTALPISFLSDYGYRDEFAGVCRGVIAKISRESPLIDVTHGIAPGDVRHGALALANAIPHLPAGVHLAVVDPGVGTTRRPIAVRTARGGRLLVGPDNGLLAPSLELCGGTLEAVDLSLSKFAAAEVSSTFHGRDIFAPVAARLALGVSLAEAGDQIDPAALATLALPKPIVADDHVVAHVLYLDGFGNASLDLSPAQLQALGGEASSFDLRVREEILRVPLASTFGDVPVGKPLLFEDASGRLALAVNRGNARRQLDLAVDQQLVLRPA